MKSDDSRVKKGQPRKEGKTTIPSVDIKFNWETVIIRRGRPRKKTETGSVKNLKQGD